MTTEFNAAEHHARRLCKAAADYYFLKEVGEVAGRTLQGEPLNGVVKDNIRSELFAALLDYRLNVHPFSESEPVETGGS